MIPIVSLAGTFSLALSAGLICTIEATGREKTVAASGNTERLAVTTIGRWAGDEPHGTRKLVTSHADFLRRN